MISHEQFTWHCPVHQRPLAPSDHSLVCDHDCRYPHRGGIPRFVSSDNYSAAFGSQWKRYRVTQLDSYTGVPISRERLKRCLGDEVWADLREKRVLEAGCGAGRFTEILLEQGATVTSIDLSEAVEANQENCPQTERHRIAQADIMALPFYPQQFDVVLCLGVIQHTPNPERTIAALYQHVKPGGWLVFDHYTYNWLYYTKAAPYFRMLFRRLSPERSLRWSEQLVDALLPLHRRMQDARLIHSLFSRLSPVLCYYRSYPELNDELQRQWALLDTHDALTDWFKHFRTREQIECALEALGAAETTCRYGGIGVEARARKPA
ncbi:MAG TPA: class I SAM-dependent methyltransferase [Pyrinomonadaceae bacterium]